MNNLIYIEYDNSLLSTLSNKLDILFKNNNYDTYILGNNLTLNEKINIIKSNNNKKFIISNRINSNNNLIEIIYPLKDNDILAKTLSNNLNNVDKYYQLRSSINTNLDYYELLRNINNNQGIVIKYGSNLLNNDNIIEIIFNTINKYLNEENIYLVKSGDSLYSIARKFNVTVDDIKKINNLSSNNLSINQKLIIPEIIKDEPNNQDDLSNQTYIVKSGDSLYSIAKRFNTTVDDIKKINNLSSNNLSINQVLLIPNISNNSSNQTYVVKSGDSLYSIARRFNTTVDDIKKINNLSSNNLSINQILLIPNISNNSSNQTYTVKSGDSLYSIAKRFNTTVDDIKKINNLTSNNLSINQVLLIPNQ